MTVKKIKELRRRMDVQNEELEVLNKELENIENNQMGMKNTITKVKRTLKEPFKDKAARILNAKFPLIIIRSSIVIFNVSTFDSPTFKVHYLIKLCCYAFM